MLVNGTTLDAWALSVLGALGLSAAGCSGSSTLVAEDAGPVPACERSQPHIVQGMDSGFAMCGDVWHRPVVRDCPARERTDELVVSQGEGEHGPADSCASDFECADRPHGYCVVAPTDFSGETFTRCTYGCVRDADCSADQICFCGDPVGVCRDANCTSDSDCEAAMCVGVIATGFCGRYTFTCPTPEDECLAVADCAEFENCDRYIDRPSACEAECTPGRPFLVGGKVRTAPPVSSPGWLGGAMPDCTGLSGADRAVVAECWLEAALMEHASIAAFARFALELVSLAAPPELVLETAQALNDETEHAQICFALASAFADEPLGPGALEVGDSVGKCAALDIFDRTFREGCVGETVAAVLAAEAGAGATDPVVRDVLTKIHRDESRHAILAWRTVQWMLRGALVSIDDARRVMRGALTDARIAGAARRPGVPSHGALSSAQAAQVNGHVLERVERIAGRVLADTESSSRECAAA